MGRDNNVKSALEKQRNKMRTHMACLTKIKNNWPKTLCATYPNSVYKVQQSQVIWILIKIELNKAGYTAIRCVLARTDSVFGQKRHFCMVSTRV